MNTDRFTEISDRFRGIPFQLTGGRAGVCKIYAWEGWVTGEMFRQTPVLVGALDEVEAWLEKNTTV